ncbi:pentatricopeptide repeat (PPR) superfamily protein [Striga asiatica]|uniref:Pentatricopeptide repeat (PPR) superfamily protein n=1 Tax=Striga asiatica TaxID=4170 RepID=A0A5A7RCT9_STRAF|nr:pentatricopeptide repeat (PPR) superfamily protein [Striga asiatica]
MRQFGAVWALIEQMRIENPQLLSPEVFIILMRRFASTRMVKKAIEVLDEMPKYGCEPDEYVFGCLFDALCKNGSVKEASLLFEDMRERFEPTIKQFTSLLYGWCKAGKLMEAKVVLVRMREAGFEPDVVVYNNLLLGYSTAGKMTDAFHLMQEMRKNGYEPNAGSYTIVVQGLCAQEKIEEAMRIFSEMEKNGCEADIITYSTLISGFCKWGKIQRAYEYLDEMIRKGHTPSPLTYLYFMLAHERKEELEECLELIKEMRNIGGVNAWTIWIHALFSNGHVKEACSYCLDMMDAGLMPQPDTFAKLMRGLRKLYNRQIAAEITEKVRKMAKDRNVTFKMYKRRGERDLREKDKTKDDGRKRRARKRRWGSRKMVERGLFSVPQYGVLKDLLNSLLRADNKLQLAKDLWSCILNKGCELNVYAWTIWIHALFSNGHVKEACSYCLDMMDAGLMPQPDTFAKLMRGLRKLYNRQIAAEITEKVRKMAKDRNVTFKMYKRRGERDLREKDKAKDDGRKRRARKRRWGSRSRKADSF